MISIRRATGDDVPAIVQLERECFRTPWGAESVAAYVGSPGRGAWVAEVEGRACGYLLAAWVLDEGSVDRVGVAPHVRRRGIARVLMERVIAALVGRGVRQIWLEVAESNEAAVQLYRKMGFAIAGRRRAYYAGLPPEDALLMRKVVE